MTMPVLSSWGTGARGIQTATSRGTGHGDEVRRAEPVRKNQRDNDPDQPHSTQTPMRPG